MSYQPEFHSLKVSRTAHYSILGTPAKKVKKLWIVTHGYGQLSKTFIRRFQTIMDDETMVIAPEGLSRFYWGGFDGPIVASWMTREDRLDEIADYVAMLDQLYNHYVPLCHPDVEITLFGFSQGTATQVRWIMHSFPHFHKLMLWAGQLPEDLDYKPHLDYFEDKALFTAFGDKDPLVTPKRLSFMRKVIAESGLKISEFSYEGVHKVERLALQRWMEEL